MSEIDVPTEDVYVEELRESAIGGRVGEWRVYLADVFLLLVAIQAGIWGEFCQSRSCGRCIQGEVPLNFCLQYC